MSSLWDGCLRLKSLWNRSVPLRNLHFIVVVEFRSYVLNIVPDGLLYSPYTFHVIGITCRVYRRGGPIFPLVWRRAGP